GREVAPDALPRKILSRRRELGTHFRPVAVEFLGHELRQTGQRSLTHFGAGDPDHDGVVGIDDDPGIDLGRARRRLRGGLARKWNAESDDETAANRGRGTQELPARHHRRVHAGLPSTCSIASPAAFTSPDAAALIAARTRLYVPQRQMLVICASMSASLGF